jgi:hypothetical protein
MRVRGWSQVDLLKVAQHLYRELGFNVIPVDSEKKPIGEWNADKRLNEDTLTARLKDGKASGLAITGRFLANNEDYGIAIFDIDDPAKGEEVLRQVFGDDWKARLCGQTWSFCGLTGPRPKGKVKCECKEPGQDCECINTETNEKRKLSELPRGMYIVVRVPRRCLPSGTGRHGAIELLINNYEVVYGRHPSGAFYEPVRFENGGWVPVGYLDLGPGEVITCEELGNLIALLTGGKTSGSIEELGGGDSATAVELNLPEPSLELSDDKIQEIIDAVAPLWWLEDESGKHYHDVILYGLSSLMRRAGIKYETARKVAEGIINAAIRDMAAKGVSNDELTRVRQQEERHLRETVDYAYGKYGGGNPRLWGRNTFETNLRDFIEKAHKVDATVYEPNEWFSIIYNAIGIRLDTLICIPITKVTIERTGANVRIDEIGRESVSMLTEFICNDVPFGIVHKKKKRESKKRRGGETEDESAEGRLTTVTNALLKWSFMKFEVYYDPFFDITYANAVAVNEKGNTREFSMIKLDRLKRELEDEHSLVRQNPKWDVIFQSAKPKVTDVIVSGFVCPPPDQRLPCTVRDYFDVGLARAEVNKALARDAIQTVLNTVVKYHPEPETFLRGLVYGAFTNFSLTWKMHGLKPKMVALKGVRDSGKTTIGYLLNWMFNPRIDTIMPTSVLLSPARVGRGVELLTNAVVTTPIVFDEAGTSAEKGVVKLEGNVANVLKNYVTQKYTWVTATGVKIPATSGVVLTANQLTITDPALEDKIVTVDFAYPIPRDRQVAGTPELRGVKDKLVFFGKYYLQYAADNWANVKDIILAADWESAAITYFNTVLQSLGLPPLNLTVEEREEPTYRYAFRRLLQEFVREHQGVCLSNSTMVDFWSCLEFLINNNYIPFIKPYKAAEGVETFRITTEVEQHVGVSTKVLCPDLGGELLSRRKTRNSDYLNNCIIDKDALAEAIGAATLSTGNASSESSGEGNGNAGG